MKHWVTAGAALALALLTFFQFPGHTYLQQDTQIYVPILEHLRDPSVLRNDILVEQSHVAFTLYDETARFLRAATGLGFREVLEFQQIVTRALGIWGLYLIALALGLSPWAAAVVAAICSLGAAIPGPAVLTFEYEPTPRAFAIPLLICAIGLTGHGRHFAAGIAGAVAFLYHPPSTIPFWVVFAILPWPRRGAGTPACRVDTRVDAFRAASDPLHTHRFPLFHMKAAAFIPLAIGAIVLAIAALLQAGSPSGEAHTFFARLTPLQVQIQKFRAPYVWISTWASDFLPQYVILCAILTTALVRLRHAISLDLAPFVLGLPLLGIISMPLSWFLLEGQGLAILPQIQPLRGLLFVVLMVQILTAAAALHAVKSGRRFEAAVWFVVAYLAPIHPVIPRPISWNAAVVLLALAAATTLAARMDTRLAVAAALAAFFAIPIFGGVLNYPHLHTPELAQLSAWARQSTPPDTVFAFPDAGRALYPGIFRSEALRAVYVDWKGGGQVNYLPEFAEQWWFRRQQTMANAFHPADAAKYSGLGIQYVVLQTRDRLSQAPLFENTTYAVYPVR